MFYISGNFTVGDRISLVECGLKAILTKGCLLIAKGTRAVVINNDRSGWYQQSIILLVVGLLSFIGSGSVVAQDFSLPSISLSTPQVSSSAPTRTIFVVSEADRLYSEQDDYLHQRTRVRAKDVLKYAYEAAFVQEYRIQYLSSARTSSGNDFHFSGIKMFLNSGGATLGVKAQSSRTRVSLKRTKDIDDALVRFGVEFKW